MVLETGGRNKRQSEESHECVGKWKPWRTEISCGLFLKVRYSLSPELVEKISFWHDVENTREMMKKVMLKREYGDVFDYG